MSEYSRGFGNSIFDDQRCVGANRCCSLDAQFATGEIRLEAGHGRGVQIQALNVRLVDDVGDRVLHGSEK